MPSQLQADDVRELVLAETLPIKVHQGGERLRVPACTYSIREVDSGQCEHIRELYDLQVD